jgi:hypothetical protein
MPVDPTLLDPNAAASAVANTGDLPLFNPAPNPLQIIGDALGRRRGIVPSILGGFVSSAGQTRQAREQIPGMEKLLAAEGHPLSEEQLKAYGTMDPAAVIQQLNLLTKQAMQKQAAQKLYEPKDYWDPNASGGKGGIVSKRPDESKEGLMTLGEHGRMQAQQAGKGIPTLYKDIREDTLSHGGSVRDAINEYKRYQESLAVQKVVQEAQQKPIGEDAKNWANGALQNPDPSLNRHEAFEAGNRPMTPQQQENTRRLASAYTDLTGAQIQKDLKQVLRSTPAATEGSAAWQTFARNPAVARINAWNTNMLQMINPTFTKTLRVNEKELEMLRSYFIKLPTWRSPIADTMPQAQAKIQMATKLLNRALKQAGADPNQFKGDADSLTKYDTTDDDTKAAGDDALKAAGF